MSNDAYADEFDYKYLRARLREAQALLRAAIQDSQMNVDTVTGQLIHAWLTDYSPEPQEEK